MELRFNDRWLLFRKYHYGRKVLAKAQEAEEHHDTEWARKRYSEAADIFLRSGFLGDARYALRKAGRMEEHKALGEFLGIFTAEIELRRVAELKRRIAAFPDKLVDIVMDRPTKMLPEDTDSWYRSSWSSFFKIPHETKGNGSMWGSSFSLAARALGDAKEAERAGDTDKAMALRSRAADIYIENGDLDYALGALYKSGRLEEACRIKEEMLAQIDNMERGMAMKLAGRAASMPDWSRRKVTINRLVQGILRDAQQ
jgi:tetratricopeptide (TPR) repeat protein